MGLMALAGIGLVATPGTARADFITFTVNEDAIGSTGLPDFQATLINGAYSANLTLGAGGGGLCPVTATLCGSWQETATANLTKYYLNPPPAPTAGPSYIGVDEVINPNGYSILGSLTSQGTFYRETCGSDECYYFAFTAQTGSLGADTNQDGTVDIALLSASGVGAGTTGQLVVVGGIPTTGSFNSVFTSNTLTPTAQAYWPTLALIQFTTTINGDINDGSTLQRIVGDVSVQFNAVPQVPEPATLGLLSLGLAAGARHIRRRRAEKV
jgi:hypothetical protein